MHDSGVDVQPNWWVNAENLWNNPLRAESAPGSARCDWLLTFRDASQNRNLDIRGWTIATEMRRPSERSERFILYRRAK